MIKDSDITAVVPVFNRDYLIEETINSLINQTISFSEIIVVNDGSTDETADILGKYGDKLTIINIPNRGVQEARNTGVRAARTGWITFCDSDDILKPVYVESVNRFLANHAEIKLLYSNFSKFSGSRIWGNRGREAPSWFFEGAERYPGFYHNIPDLYRKILKYQLLWPTGMTVSRQFYLDINGFDVRIHGIKSEDLEFTMRAISQTDCAFSIEPLVLIRVHDGNDSRDDILQIKGEIKILDFIIENHEYAKKFSGEIRESIDKRYLELFRLSFKRGMLDDCMKYLSNSNNIELKVKDKIKSQLVSLHNKNIRQAACYLAKHLI